MKKIFSGLLLLLLFSSCSILKSSNDPLEIIIKGENFTIAWDDDSLGIPENPYKAEKYNVYYKTHGGFFWIFLGEVPASENPGVSITSETLDYGLYDLGVSAVSSSGVESAIHSSLDSTADPFCGWYINWIGSR